MATAAQESPKPAARKRAAKAAATPAKPAAAPAARKKAAAAAPRKTAARAAKPAPEAVAGNGSGPGRLAEAASNNTLAVNPLIGLSRRDLGEGVQAFFSAAIKNPTEAAKHLGTYAVALTQVLRGRQDKPAEDGAAPPPKDKRFADPAWTHSPIHRRLQQAHAVTGDALNAYIDGSDLKERDKARAKLVASIYIDAIAPSNSLMNPTALKRAIDSGGLSLLKGAKNLVHDMRTNGGLPSSVDKSKFAFGKNICLTPGTVIYRSEVLELIQYHPVTDEVLARPLVICPPQVNKFYALDLSPEKSFVKFATEHGVQAFAISWRNPGKEHRDWDMSTYVKALDEAVDVARAVTGSPDVSLWGACSGGMTAAAYLGWLAATGKNGKVANVISPVCVLDPAKTSDTTMGLLVTPESLRALRATVKKRGYVDGNEMARVFAWLRPNDLIWNYWVNNYLLGNDPPAFDILFWNADTTRLPGNFHADLLGIFEKNPFTEAGRLKIMGKPIDMGKVAVDAYIVAGITDHITPWKSCYDTARIYGPKSEFVLANAGHLQSLLNPPGAPKAYFFAGPAKAKDGDDWSQSASRNEGSWWPHWLAWMSERSGAKVPAPKKPGNRKYRPMEAAPGTYVLEP